MSVDTEVFVGPYLWCGLANSKKIPYKRYTTKSCMNKKCKDYGHYKYEKFCSNCGTEIGDGYIESLEDSITAENVDEKIGVDVLVNLNRYNKKFHAWIANHKIEGMDDIDCGFLEIENVSEGMMEAHKNAFAKKYQDEIKDIKEIYGEDQVEVRWGIFHYSM